jgi:hypothetical protein
MSVRFRLSILIACLFVAVTGCSREPSPGDAYLAYRKAFDAAKSIDDLIPHMAKETRAKMEAAPAEERAMGFDMMKSLNDYLDVAIVNATVTGAMPPSSRRDQHVRSDARGTIEMANEDGAWKIKNEKWSDEKPAGRRGADVRAAATDPKSDKAAGGARRHARAAKLS